MFINSEDLFKGIVSAIQNGSKNAEYDSINKYLYVENAKWENRSDFIFSSLKQELDKYSSFKSFILYRGFGRKILLEYDTENRILYSFMSHKRMAALISSGRIKDKNNYIFGLSQFNSNEVLENQQLSFSDELFAKASEDNLKVYEQVKNLINEENDIKYITVTYDLKGYEVLSVDVFCISNLGEAHKLMNLNKYLDVVDYDKAIVEINNTEENEDDLNIVFVEGIIDSKDEIISEEMFIDKNKNEENNNEKWI